MNQILIGRFISEQRKSKRLTQKQLADELGISDKTVSKWECGKGLPEVSLMIPLCDKLEITVNDLLSGKKVTDDEYRGKAETNIINLVMENEKSRRKYIISVINGIITIIAALALIFIASYFKLNNAVRIILIAAALIVAVFGIASSAVLDRESGVFECPYCKALFTPEMREYIKGRHTITKRKLTCPKCGKKSMCRHKIIK